MSSSSLQPEELRKAVLRRQLYPSAAPEVVVNEAVDEEANNRQQQTSGALVLHNQGSTSTALSLVTGAKRNRDINAPPTRTGASSSVDVTSTAIVAVAPELLKQEAQRKAAGGIVHEEAIAAVTAVKEHQPWELSKVMLDHKGWVRCIAVDPSNEWFATGSADTTIKVWDMATSRLKFDLTGHKDAVRGLSISKTSPFMFSVSEDHSVKCWDLETNTIIRDFNGHTGAVYGVSAHPSLDVVVSCGRDKTVRVWDLRTTRCVHTMIGHTDNVLSVTTQNTDPQVISGGADGMVYLWDLGTGKPITRLTRHKKPVRALIPHPLEETLVTVGADHIRKWKLPIGEFYTNLMCPQGMGKLSSVANELDETLTGGGRWSCAALDPTGTKLFVGGEAGYMRFYNWATHSLVQQRRTKPFPKGNTEDVGVQCCAFDNSGTWLITGETDKTVKMWKQKEKE